MGMMLGGGVGREMANWVIDGSPQLDLFSMDVTRFHADNVKDDTWLQDRTHESYAKTYVHEFISYIYDVNRLYTRATQRRT